MVGSWTHSVPEFSHVGDLDFDSASIIDIRDEEKRFFNRQLRGIDGDMAAEKSIWLYIIRANI